jgi:uncharacterized membrane protein
MHLVYPLPWWLASVLAAGIGGLTYSAYRRPLVPLSGTRRAVLIVCRALVLTLLVVFLFRPVLVVPPQSLRHAIVAVLVDRSRSMRVADADGQPRLSKAIALLRGSPMTAWSRDFTTDVYGVGDRVERAALDGLSADAPRSDLAAALNSIVEQYRGQQLAGIVLLSDGGDSGASRLTLPADSPPVFTVGIGSPDGVADREVTGMAAGDQRLDQTTIDLRVSVSSAGFGRSPFDLRLLANGREVERRHITPQADRTSIAETFTVSPDPAIPTVYTAEIPSVDREAIVENNRWSVLVNPAGRKRRLLVVEGAPGFEHTFMKRAWAADPALEVDDVGRKGRNAEGHDTFFVQADATRGAALAHGFPERREDLYAYDALVLANVDGDAFTHAQLTMAAEFVSERGGGLVVVGGRSFAARGLSGTALEHVLPVELSDRRTGAISPVASAGGRTATGQLVLTGEGDAHPVMRIGNTVEETRRMWAALPPLSSIAPVGGPRPGAAVLAITTAPAGIVYPVVAVQRYGQGRSMIFSGEASWRWKMLLPSGDRSFEYFWRQAARWAAGPAPDPVSITVPDTPSTGDIPVIVDVRDTRFAPVGDAIVTATLTSPDGTRSGLQWRVDGTGRYTAAARAEAPGLYRISLDARRGNVEIGSAERWMEVGGVDREFVDPRLNDAWLRRVAGSTGGRYVRPADVSKIAGWLHDTHPQAGAPERRDLWHEPLAFVAIIVLLCGEWILRRRWGLR